MSAPDATPDLGEILNQIALTEDDSSYEALTRWCDRYPHHRDALSAYFATWAEQNLLPGEQSVDADRFANRAVSHALNLLYQEKQAGQSAPASETLSAAAKRRGFDDPKLAQCSGMDEAMILKLSRRRIPIETIPDLCFERLGILLAMPFQEIAARLRGPPLVASAGARLRSKQKPVHRVETFSDALENSTLDDADKAVWRAAIAVHARKSLS